MAEALKTKTVPFGATLKALLRELQRAHGERLAEALQAAATEAGYDPKTVQADLDQQVWLVKP